MVHTTRNATNEPTNSLGRLICNLRPGSFAGPQWPQDRSIRRAIRPKLLASDSVLALRFGLEAKVGEHNTAAGWLQTCLGVTRLDALQLPSARSGSLTSCALVDPRRLQRMSDRKSVCSGGGRVGKLGSETLSPHHRLVIALHSPGGVAGTGLCAWPPEKNARNLAREIRRATISGAV